MRTLRATLLVIFVVGYFLPKAFPRRPHSARSGVAAWYGQEFRGHRMANGQRFDPEKYTAASLHLELGTRIRVFNLRNGKSVVVTVTDRGPYARGRILDLSHGAARRIDCVRSGTCRVRYEVVKEVIRGPGA